MLDFLVPVEVSEVRLKIRNSRFLGWASFAESEIEARNIINLRGQQFSDATHNCWAYRLYFNQNIIERYSDAGEPAGTAGRPILDELRKANIVKVVLVVSRWFGGIKLGKGGLIRAYGACAYETIKGLNLRVESPTTVIKLKCAYEQINLVEKLSVRCKSWIVSRLYGNKEVEIEINVPNNELIKFKELITDESGGRIKFY